MHRLFVLAILSACGPDAVAWPAPAPALRLSSDVLTFPATPVGQRSSARVLLRNEGAVAAEVSLATWGAFSLDATRLEVGAGGEVPVTVSFAPTAYADARGALLLDGTVAATWTAEVPVDADEDGAVAVDAGGEDCDDLDPAVFPAAPDACGDGVDADCSPAEDCDGDGAPAWVDCDDDDPLVFPGGNERENAVDDDCDALVDEHLLRHGDVVFSEIAPQDPAWVEVCNPNERSIPLTGLTLGTRSGTWELPLLTVAPSTCASICASEVRACDAQVELILAGAADTLTLAGGGVVVDAVTLDESWDWRAGRIWSLDPAALDASQNNAPDVWCETIGSPGEPNPACP